MGCTGVRWLLPVLLVLASNPAAVYGAARFLGHVPQDDRHQPARLDDPTRPAHDADVKLPGRHYPKLPYTVVDPHDHPAGGLPRPRPAGDYHHDAYYWGEERGGGTTEPLRVPQSDTSGAPLPSRAEPAAQEPSPRFDRNQPRSVKVQAGKTAVLVCRVLDLGDKSVSWMRHEDLHILTVDKYKYSTDHRLSVEHDAATHEWLLRIQSVAQEDAGMYECQVSTRPLLSFIVSLQVLDAPPPTTTFPSLRDAEGTAAPTPRPVTKVPSATILNGPEIHVHRDSLINLTCVVELTTERPLFVVWYHYDKVVDYEAAGGAVVATHSGHRTVSRLLVPRAEQSDSGKYTCKPSSGEDAHVTLHVLDGEHPGALQTNGGRRGGVFCCGVFLVEVVVGPLLLPLLQVLVPHAPY